MNQNLYNIMQGKPNPFRIIESLPDMYQEEDLIIKNFSLIKLFIFDIDSVSNQKIDPEKFCENIVHNGLGVACRVRDEIYGKSDYLARKLNLINEEIRTLLLSQNEEDKKKAETKIASCLESFPKVKVAGFEDQFLSLSSLLKSHISWEKENLNQFSKNMFSRTILFPLLIKFKSIEEFRLVRILFSVYKSGISTLSFWLYPADEKLKLDEIKELIKSPNEVEVDVAFPVNLGEAIDVDTFDDILKEVQKYMQINYKRKDELDEEANKNDVAKEFDLTYISYHSNFYDVFAIYKFLIYSLYLDLTGKKRKIENYNLLEKTTSYQINLLNLFEFSKKIKNPFKEIITSFPRQIYALITKNNEFKTTTSSIIQNELIDLSTNLEFSQIFSPNMLLEIPSSKYWDEMQKSKNNKFINPQNNEISNYVNVEILSFLKVLSESYNSFLREVLDLTDINIEELTNVEKLIIHGYEEAQSFIHSMIKSSSWQSFAEEKLRINYTQRFIEKKLTMVRKTIDTKRYTDYMKTHIDLVNKIEKSSKVIENVMKEVENIGYRVKDFVFFIAALMFISIVNQTVLGDWRISIILFIIIPLIWLLLFHRKKAKDIVSKLS